MGPERHLVVISLPKSGTVFVQRALEMTVAAVHCPIGTSIHARKAALDEFMQQPIGLTGDHLRANRQNLEMLAATGITRIVLMIRDPRDCMVSWRHHLHRHDIRQRPNLGVSSAYFNLSPEEQFEEHISGFFSKLQQWLREWSDALSGTWPFVFHLLKFEDFAADPRGAVREVLRFFGYELEPILPDAKGPPEQISAGIHTHTHFRRGIVGSHRDELSPRLLRQLNARVDRELFARYGWPIAADETSPLDVHCEPAQTAPATPFTPQRRA